MKNKTIFFSGFLLLSVVIVLTSCGAYSIISSSTDLDTDYSNYRTFAWLPDQMDSTNVPYNNEIIRNNIKNYFGQSFSKRGFTVNLEEPDILLKIIIHNNKKEKIVVYSTFPGPFYQCNYYYGSSYYFPYSSDYYYRHRAAYCYPANFYSQRFEYFESSITLNVFDRVGNKLIWTGTAKGDIYDPLFINKNIHPAVKSIMRKFPVKTKRKHSLRKEKMRNNSFL
jgi:hypothetical protein